MILSIVCAVIAVVSWVVVMLVNWTEQKTKIVSLVLSIVVLLSSAGGIVCMIVENKAEDGESSTVEDMQETTSNNLSGQYGQFGQSTQPITEQDSQSTQTITDQYYQSTQTITTAMDNANLYG